MPDTRRYLFHGHSAAIGGRIVRLGEGKQAQLVKDGFIDLPASALTVVGGRSTASLRGDQIAHPIARSFVRFERATASSEGVFDDARGHLAVTLGERSQSTLTATTRVRSEVVALDIGLEGKVRMQVGRIRGGFTAQSASPSGETPVQLDKDTTFEKVTFVDEKGKSYTLIVEVEPSVFRDHDTFSKLTAAASESVFQRRFGHTLFLAGATAGRASTPTAPVLARTDGGAVQGTIVKPLRWKGAAFPGSTINPDQRNIVSIPGLGRVAFGEITVARQSRRVTMIRASLGSPIGGDFAAADFQDNGSWG